MWEMFSFPNWLGFTLGVVCVMLCLKASIYNQGGLYDLTGDYTLSLLVICGSFVTSSVVLLMILLKRRIQSRRSRDVPP